MSGETGARRCFSFVTLGGGGQQRIRSQESQPAKGIERERAEVWVVSDALRRAAPASGRAVLVCT
jgi:hypothetical protein